MFREIVQRYFTAFGIFGRALYTEQFLVMLLQRAVSHGRSAISRPCFMVWRLKENRWNEGESTFLTFLPFAQSKVLFSYQYLYENTSYAEHFLFFDKRFKFVQWIDHTCNGKPLWSGGEAHMAVGRRAVQGQPLHSDPLGGVRANEQPSKPPRASVRGLLPHCLPCLLEGLCPALESSDRWCCWRWYWSRNPRV